MSGANPAGPPKGSMEERLQKLAADKSYLQLLIHMINRVNALPGLENTVQNLLTAVTDSIGGTNAILYFPMGGEWVQVADILGRREEIREIDDPLAAAVYRNRTFVEKTDDFSRTLMETEEFSKAYTWVFPLTVAEELVGVFKIENLHIGAAPWQEHLTTFFHYAALALKNEIQSHSRLKRANEELAREVVIRKEKETLLGRAKGELEKRVRERTRSLAESNDRLERELALRAQAEEEVRRKEEEYRILFERIDAAVVVHDADTRIVSANSRALAILGITLDQAVGRTALHPEWRFLDHERAPLPLGDYPVNRVIATGEPFTGMILGVNRPETGDLVWVVVSATPVFGGDGAIRQVVVSFMDITDQIETRNELARLYFAIDQSADGVMITEPDGAILYVNRGFETTTGYTKEEALGKTPAILKSGKHDASFYREIWSALAASLPWRGSVINKRKNGSLYEAELTISPIPDETGTVRYFVGNMRDITQEAAFARARNHFSAIVAHEIRTPLTKLELVKIFVATVRETLPDQDMGVKLSQILDEAMEGFNRLSHITNVFTHLVSHGAARMSATQDLTVVIPSSVSLTRQRADGEGREVPVVYTGPVAEGNLKIVGDYYLLNMAVEEILSNAIKYSQDGSPVTVTLTRRENQAVVEVRDRGKGVPPESVAMVFEPFFSLEEKLHHSTGKYKYCGGGLGLGLTVARLVAEVHGGLIELESDGVDQGTVVRLTLPLAP